MGVVVLAERQDRTLLVMVVAPLALAMVAAALRRYPTAGRRFAMVRLAGLPDDRPGRGLVVGRHRKADVRRRVFQVAVGSLFVLAIATLAKDMAKPYKRLVDFEHRGFVRWFWKENASEGRSSACTRTSARISSRAAPRGLSLLSAGVFAGAPTGAAAWRSRRFAGRSPAERVVLAGGEARDEGEIQRVDDRDVRGATS